MEKTKQIKLIEKFSIEFQHPVQLSTIMETINADLSLTIYENPDLRFTNLVITHNKERDTDTVRGMFEAIEYPNELIKTLVYVQNQLRQLTVSQNSPEGKCYSAVEKALEKVYHPVSLPAPSVKASEAAEAVEILTELCQLKHYKDEVGKDSMYERKQPELWKRANEFLNRIAGTQWGNEADQAVKFLDWYFKSPYFPLNAPGDGNEFIDTSNPDNLTVTTEQLYSLFQNK